MQIVVPMAGLGSRFSKSGFVTPKPLIDVSGVPMVVRAVKDLPKSDSVTFIVHSDHVRQHRVDSILKSHFPHANIVIAPGLTEGQACTVRLAEASLDPEDDVLVAACDATHVYSAARFEKVRQDMSISAAVWTYRNEPNVVLNPNAYGWAEVADGEVNITRISCKRPISDSPLRDHVVSGFFWFRSARMMNSAIDTLVASNCRVNNEFYLDVVPNIIIDSGGRVVVFEVDKHISWGTPDDLQRYKCWERYFAAA